MVEKYLICPLTFKFEISDKTELIGNRITIKKSIFLIIKFNYINWFNDSFIFFAISKNSLETSCSGSEWVSGSPLSAELLKS